MQHETLTYVADGLTMRGQLFLPYATGPSAGVLVFPEAGGLGEHAVGRAERLAALGFAALACDLHGEGWVTDLVPEAIGLIGPLLADPARIRARAGAALRALVARPEVDASRVAAIGYCFGGTMALELARAGEDLRAVVGFHSGLGTVAAPAAPGSVRPRVLACVGADDPFILPEQRAVFEAEMRAAGADWQLHLYGGAVHSFTNPEADARGMPAMRYDAAADARSWDSMRALFTEALHKA